MQELKVEHIDSFMDYYKAFHDSYIKEIYYEVAKSEIKMKINVFWSGEPTLKEDGTYETHPVKLEMVFKDIEECNIKTVEEFNEIQSAYLKHIHYHHKDLFCFSDDKEHPTVYIVAGSIFTREYKSE